MNAHFATQKRAQFIYKSGTILVPSFLNWHEQSEYHETTRQSTSNKRIFLHLQEFGVGQSKIETLPFPSGLSPLTQIEDNHLFKHTSFVKGELGTRIDKYRPLVISLVRRQTTTLVGSLVLIVELGAQMLATVAARNSEYAHTVYKCIIPSLNKRSWGIRTP